MKFLVTALTALFFAGTLGFWAQAQSLNGALNERPSIRQIESEKYKALGFTTEAEYDAYNGYAPKKAGQALTPQAGCNLTKEVFGYHPYWAGSAYTSYDFSLISTVCYFSYEVVPSTGNYSTVHSWKTSTIVQTAHNAGKKVVLGVTCFGSTGLTTFLGNATSRARCIDSLVALVQLRGADGVNIDFEGVPSSQKANYTAFMNALATKFHSVMPGSQVSQALPAVDWANSYDVGNMPGVDLHIIMGYDFYWTTAPNAGPSGLLYPGAPWGSSSESTGINSYINKGVSPGKIIMAVPYYGFDYPTGTSSTLHAATTGSGSSITYTVAKGKAALYGRQWNSAAPCPYYMYQSSGAWRQAYYEDSLSLSIKYDVIKQRNIGGMGVWALSYDGANTELWGAIRDKFTSCSVVSCNGTFTDQGGPAGNYQNNENWTYTLAPTGATGVTVVFNSFATELNRDTLWVYNGTSTAAPLLGAFHGATSPGTLTGTSGALTFRFKSNASTTGAGWSADWSCSTQADVTPPTTAVNALPNWVTADFTATFNDADNNAVSGRFYQVQGYDGANWKSNTSNGFFNDDFATLGTAWTPAVGTWTANGTLNQPDETVNNSNIYASFNQSGAYYYSWRAKMSGSGTNRRSGLHFFADNATAANHGNSYLVWFRIDQSKVEIYKNVNDVLNVVASASLTITPGVWYQYGVSFDPATGKLQAYRDGIKVASWTDSSPYTSGAYVAFRNGNCNVAFDDFNIFKGRNASALVTVGTNKDAGYQSPNASTPALKIFSLAQDLTGNLSTIASAQTKVDWTAPAAVTALNDGTSTDIDVSSSLTTLSANWAASSDVNSNVAAYEYAIGTTAGGTQLLGWTANGTATTFTRTDLTLSPNVKYYVSVRVTNGAGLKSTVFTSDGVLILVPCVAPSVGLSSTNITSNSATVQWGGVTGAVSYTLQYKVATDLNWTTVTVTGTSYNLTALLAGTGYRWQVSTNCSGNQTSAYGALQQFTTTTCAVPVNTQTISVSTSTATVRWSAVTGATGYVVQYKVQNTTTWTTVNVTSAQLALSGLSPATTYVWQVATKCGSDQSAYSAPVSFTTTVSCSDANESNNSSTTATAVLTNAYKLGKICPSTDVDWYKVVLSATTNLRVTVSQLPANYNLELYIGGSFVTGSYNTGTTNEVIIRNGQTANTLYYRVYGVSGATNSLVDYIITTETSTTPYRNGEEEINAVPAAITLYPNPFVGKFSIDLNLTETADVEVQLLDMTGAEVYRAEYESLSGFQTLAVEAPNLASGVYLAKVRAGNFVKTARMILTK